MEVNKKAPGYMEEPSPMMLSKLNQHPAVYSIKEAAEILFPYVYIYVSMEQKIFQMCGQKDCIPSSKVKMLDQYFGECTKSKLSKMKLMLTTTTLAILNQSTLDVKELMQCISVQFKELDYCITIQNIYIAYYIMILPYQNQFLTTRSRKFFSTMRRIYTKIEHQFFMRDKAPEIKVLTRKRTLLDDHPDIKMKIIDARQQAAAISAKRRRLAQSTPRADDGNNENNTNSVIDEICGRVSKL